MATRKNLIITDEVSKRELEVGLDNFGYLELVITDYDAPQTCWFSTFDKNDVIELIKQLELIVDKM